MAGLRCVSRLVPRAMHAQFVHTAPRTMSMSMKEEFNAAGDRGRVPSTDYYKELMNLQTHMTKDDGLLVWQKRGTRDTYPYYGTMGLCVLGLLISIKTFWDMSWPRPKPAE